MAEAQQSRFVTIYAERKIGADGVITITPLRTVELADDVDLVKAAKARGVSVRTMRRMCDEGKFKTAYKPGRGRLSPWRVSLSEVLGGKVMSAD